MKVITIWLRDDGSMSVLQRGCDPPAPGRVFEVHGLRKRKAAEDAVRLYLAKEPDEKADPARWLAWRRVHQDGQVELRDAWIAADPDSPRGGLKRVHVEESE